jgi:hypothetical protein
MLFAPYTILYKQPLPFRNLLKLPLYIGTHNLRITLFRLHNSLINWLFCIYTGTAGTTGFFTRSTP